jgi:hypothetical protein
VLAAVYILVLVAVYTLELEEDYTQVPVVVYTLELEEDCIQVQVVACILAPIQNPI